MSDDQFQELQDSVRRIESGLFGDEKLGHVGIVGTQQDHGKRLGRLERGVVYVSGAAFMVGVIWTVWTQWPR